MVRPRLLGIGALAAVLAVPAIAFAQQAPPAPGASVAPAQPGAGHHHRNGMRSALRSLNLTAAQQSQVDQAFAQMRNTNRNADPATRKANRQKLRAQIETILTPAQRAQLTAQMKRSHARG